MSDIGQSKPLRLCIDVNVWVAHVLALRNGWTGTAAQAIVGMVRDMRAGGRSMQLVVSVEMIATLEGVLERLGVSGASAREFCAAVAGLMKAGPEGLDPYLLLAGRDQLGMHDREDAGVLATALAAKADFLITDNLRDFVTNDGGTFATQAVWSNGRLRQLFAILHERADGVLVAVAHPVDFLAWVRDGRDLTPAMVAREFKLNLVP